MSEARGKGTRKIVLGVVAFVGIVVLMLFAYVSNSRPKCPMCRSLEQVVFSWKTYKPDAQPHQVRSFGIFGTCEHGLETDGDNRNRFSWYCNRCKIHVIKPPNWRAE
ncbi:MAG: hypothetical protein K2Z81_15630 [Cyanobacteria bacterium]|nr:hypothetical protein [Cyanobacteriota bacterium]